MDIKELLNEDALDPKKLFDEKKFSTLIVNREGFNKNQNETAELLQALLDSKITREESETIFSKLKENKAQDLMVEGIKAAEATEDKAILTAACWESGLDFTAHFLFFTELSRHADFGLAMEALTVVIESCEGSPDKATLEKALEIASSAKSKNTDLVHDLVENIKSR